MPSTGKVVGSHSGNIRDELNHVAHVIHSEGDKLDRYQVQVVSLKEDPTKDQVKAAWVSPILSLSVLGAVFAASLLGVSIWHNDGYSIIATVLLSCLSSFIGIGSKWSLKLPKREEDRFVPMSDVIISYPNGAFLIVKCTEGIARQLYWAPETCQYDLDKNWYRFISLLGTIMLMGGVITLANSTNVLQIAWAAAYMILNAAYWVVAALPTRWNWYLDSFRVQSVQLRKLPARYLSDGADSPLNHRMDPEIPKLKRAGTADLRKPGTKRPVDTQDVGLNSQNKTFTEALWQAIAVTRSSKWAKNTSIAPQTDGWNEWLLKAEEAAQATRITEDQDNITAEIPDWNYRGVLSEILGREAKEQKVIRKGTEQV